VLPDVPQVLLSDPETHSLVDRALAVSDLLQELVRSRGENLGRHFRADPFQELRTRAQPN
jgi:hypothetical protein